MSKTDRESHDELQQERSFIRKELTKLHDEICVIDVMISNLAEKIIREERLLAKKPWKYSIVDSGPASFSLVCLGNLYLDFPELDAILKPSPHDDRNFCPMVKKNYRAEFTSSTVNLHFSDGSMFLNFDSDEVAKKFVEDFGLTISLTGIEKERERIVSQLANLDRVLESAKQIN